GFRGHNGRFRTTHPSGIEPRKEGAMKGTTPDGTLNGFLDRGSHFAGDLKFEDGFRIDGRFEGKITSGSELVLGETAEVDAEINVGKLSVNGSLEGPRVGTHRGALT